MSGYVTDTHALLWYLFTPEKLESTALSIFDGIGSDDPLVVPAVVVAEMAMVVERRRIGATVNELIEVIKSLGSTTHNRGHWHHCSTSLRVTLEGLPRRLGGVQGDGGTLR